MFKNTKAAALVATALAVLAGAVAGCGSSGDSATTSASAPPVTQPGDGNAAFVADVEAICIDVNRQFRAINDNSRGREPYVTLGQAATQLRDAVSQMQAVEPPADIAVDYEAMMGLLGVQADALAERSRALRAGDDARATAAETRGEDANRDQDLIAQSLGLDACAASASEEREPPAELPFPDTPPSS